MSGRTYGKYVDGFLSAWYKNGYLFWTNVAKSMSFPWRSLKCAFCVHIFIAILYVSYEVNIGKTSILQHLSKKSSHFYTKRLKSHLDIYHKFYHLKFGGFMTTIFVCVTENIYRASEVRFKIPLFNCSKFQTYFCA